MKKIAVLLTVFNRKQQTLFCLEQLFKQYIPAEYGINVYLTDDGCTDGTAQAVFEKFPRKVNVIEGSGNLYWNRGMWTAWNSAINDGHYDYFLWLNDDTNLFEDAIANLINVSVAQNDKAIVVGATVDTLTHTCQTYGGRIGDNLIPCDGKNVECEHFNGNIVLVPEYVYSILGNLDYNLVHALGDYDYGWRARKKGIRIVQCGSVLGACDTHTHIDKWCDPSVPFSERWIYLHRPNGMPPSIIYYITRKHKGIVPALFTTIKVYLHCIFPRLWKKCIK